MESDVTQTFDYGSVPLPEDVAAVRLLRIEKATGDATGDPKGLRCKLEAFCLTSTPPYVALSYVWGKQNDCVALHCNQDSILPITANVGRVLTFLRDNREVYIDPYDVNLRPNDAMPAWLWVDSICIDQSNLQERKSQVLLMRRIYEYATTTLIWLGSIPSPVRLLIDDLARARREYILAKDTRTWIEFSGEDRARHGLQLRTLDRLWESFKALDQVLSSGWFTRVWVLQELAVSRNPILIWNATHFAMSWDHLVDTIKFGERMQLPGWVFGAGRAHFDLFYDIRRSVSTGRAVSLLQLVVACRGMSASDPRDLVYALLGIAKGPGSDMEPDYTLNTEDVYMTLHRRLSRPCRDDVYLDILSVPRQVIKIPAFTRDGGLVPAVAPSTLPSWSTDWRSRVDTSHRAFIPSSFLTFDRGSRLGNQDVFVFYDNFASTPKIDTGPESQDLFVERPFLRLRGFELSRIAVVSPTFEASVTKSGRHAKVQAIGTEGLVLKAVENLCRVGPFFNWHRHYARINEDMRDVPWQTLCAGQFLVDYADTKSGFEKWYTYVAPTRRYLPAPNSWPLVMADMCFGTLLMIRTLYHVRESVLSSDYQHFVWALSASVIGRRMFRTVDKYIGLGPPDTAKDDVVFLLKGCRAPMVLRRTDSPGRWTLIGPCYLHGFMQGEGYEEEQCADVWLV